ncbi:hypothetical protein H5410_012547, partial [Solanum commersonii]
KSHTILIIVVVRLQLRICTNNTAKICKMNFKAKNYVVICICPQNYAWELWRSRCYSQYDSEKSSINRSNILITFNIYQLIKGRLKNIPSESWEDVIGVIKWIKPSPPIFKLDTDKSCINGAYGGGGVLRDYKGRAITIFNLPLGHGTNNKVEVVSLLLTLYCSRIASSMSGQSSSESKMRSKK